MGAADGAQSGAPQSAAARILNPVSTSPPRKRKTFKCQTRGTARGDARHTLGDNLRARQAIGFAPRVSVREGVEAQWRWIEAQRAVAAR